MNTTSWQRIGIVFNKELRDNLRDRRSIFSAFLSGLIGPVLLLILIILVGKTVFQEQTTSRLQLPVQGAENAPDLIAFLKQNGVDAISPPDDPESAVRNGEADVVLVIPPGYGQDFSQGIPATVKIVMDSTRQSSTMAIERTRNLVSAYSDQIGSLRLLARGINPAVTQPLAVERVDMATPESQALIFLNMMPYFVVMVIFMGGMYVIIDTTAGERERGSLEPLLINPVPRRDFVLGKLAASWPFATATLIFTLLAFAVGFNLVPLEDYLGFQLTINPAALFGIFLISLPMILLASALQMIIATFTRSFKEAQTYVAFLPLIPALPGIGLAFLPVKASLWTMLIPTFGQQLLINQLMRGEPIDPLNMLVSILATLALSAALVWAAINLYKRERILFGSN